TIAHWEEGKTMFFDDTYNHEVWNDTDGVRVVLFLDVLRPLSFPMSAINRTVIKAIAASPLITDAKKNHEAWEQRMETLWR
ncbi:MAG: aspartyl/asparaginyl beta-hydroxylase domain-containing protein, partial [Chthoniobacterales bacterium]